jgi:PucR family transcriptional regulator, purine catabolism regulatory protein
MGNVANDVRASPRPLSAGSPAAGPGDESAVTVRALLALPAFAGTQVVAGAAGLDRVVNRANIMEVPDILPWVKPHELLLTTGYPLRDCAAELHDLVAALDDAGVAALGVKLRRYLDGLTADMLREADRRSLPVLLLPDHVAFDDLLNAVLSDVLNRESSILARTEQIHRHLVSVILDGGGLDELVAEVSARLGDVALVTTPDGRVLTSAGADVAAVLHQDALCTDTGRFRSERFDRGTHRVDGLAVAVVPLLAGRTDHGRLIVVRTADDFTRGDVHVLERAATVVALAITKSVAVQAVEAKYRGDFVRDVLQGRAGSTESVLEHFTSLGWEVSRPLVVVAAALDEGSVATLSHADARTAQERFCAAWSHVVCRRDKTAPVVGFTSEVVALIGVPADRPPRAVIEALVREVSGDGGGGRRPFSAGVSRLVLDPAAIPVAYEQARRALHVGRQLQGPAAVAHFDDLGAFRLLSLIEDTSELSNFVTEVLGALASETDPEAADLRTTLRTLLDTNLNVAETSRLLHFHYNTLRYRIAKLERIVGPFTCDPDLQLDLSLALRVLQMKSK